MTDPWSLIEFLTDPEPAEQPKDWLDHITSGDWDPVTARNGYLVGSAVTTALFVVGLLLYVAWSVTA